MVYKLIKSGQIVSLSDRQFELLAKKEQDKFFVSNDGVAKDALPQGIKDAKDKITLTEKETITQSPIKKIIPTIEKITPKIEPIKAIEPTNEIDSLFK